MTTQFSSRLLRQAPGDETDAEGILYVGKFGDFLPEPRLVAITAAKNAEPASGADGRGDRPGMALKTKWGSPKHLRSEGP